MNGLKLKQIYSRALSCEIEMYMLIGCKKHAISITQDVQYKT